MQQSMLNVNVPFYLKLKVEKNVSFSKLKREREVTRWLNVNTLIHLSILAIWKTLLKAFM